MPAARASPRAFRTKPPVLRRLVRFAGITLVAWLVVFALLLLAVRFIAFPRVEAYRDALAERLTAQLGQPVEIAALVTSWDGWNPKIAIQGFRVREPVASGSGVVLDLPEIDLIVAWTSLPLLELRLKELTIDRPRLAIRRDRAGRLHLAGIEIDPAREAEDSPLTEWLLRQPRILVRDALILWNDDLRNAPQLVLDRVQVRLENRFGRHRFGIRGTPPPELAAPIDVRGDVTGASLKEWQKTSGRLYVRLDYADVAAWKEWLPLPVPIASGEGAMRLWFDFSAGQATALTADLALADVKAKLGAKLPEMALASLSGRAGWRVDVMEQEFFARGLSFTAANGQTMPATDFSLTLTDAVDGGPAGGKLEFDRIDLEPLRALAAQLPVTERVRTDLARFAPRGMLSRGRVQWRGPVERPVTFSVASDFQDLGLVAQDALPGIRGVSGSFNATHTGGTLRLVGRNAAVELPRVFPAPIQLDSVQAEAIWEHVQGRTAVRIEKLEFANADAAGTASGTYRTAADGPGLIDLSARLARANPQQVWRYLPRSGHEGVREWLRTAFGAGSVGESTLRIAGDLARFPFSDPKSGQFQLITRAQNVTLNFDPRWPPFTGLDAAVRLDGARMTIDAARGRVLGAQVGAVRAEIADLRAPVPTLHVECSATAPMTDFVRYVDSSPLRDWTNHVLDGAQTSGGGQLTLKLDLPLTGGGGAKVDGELAMTDATVQFAGVPPLSQVNGRIAFTEHDIAARDVSAQVFGGPARVSIARAQERLRVNGTGTANLAALRRDFPSPYLDRVAGNVDWAIVVDAHPDGMSWVIESGLKGASVDLPAPLGKTGSETVPLRIERRLDARRPGEDTILAKYGSSVGLAAHRTLTASGATLDRMLLSLGKAVDRPDAWQAERSGLWVRAELPALDIDRWLNLQKRDSGTAAKTAGEMELLGADLDVAALVAFGRRYHDLKVSARYVQGEWRLDLRGSEILGSATWSAPDASARNGRVVARLSRLMAANAEDVVTPDAAAATQTDAAASSWPDVDIRADSYVSKGRDLGRLELLAHPRGAEWQIERLRLDNDAGQLESGGAWGSSGRQQQTRLDVTLDVKEAGAFLARFGLPDAVQGAPTKISGQLAWTGLPSEPDYPTLSGAFRIDVGAGRFTKLDPGVGKLLGVLSLQALPRRITLDFRDVFSEGFAFDQVAGNVKIQNGVMSTDNLKLIGPAAKVEIVGEADLARETQRLAVKVQPALSMQVSAGAALLFLANPLVGAAVGAGSLLAQKVLQDPIEQIFSYHYTVTGSWTDPVVVRTNAAATASVASPQREGAAQ